MKLLLDNVCNVSQRDALFPNSLQLPPGSLVIMTSRTEGLLRHGHYDVETRRTDLLEAAEAMELLCMSFKHAEPPKEKLELVASIVEACHGVPVVLEVVGTFLKGMQCQEYKVRASWKASQDASLYEITDEIAGLKTLFIKVRRLEVMCRFYSCCFEAN